MPLVDTHCHLLPGLDDGPADQAEALELARRLVDDGVALVVCTPHYSRQFPTDHREAAAALELLRASLAVEGIPLDLELAAEVAPLELLDADERELRRRALAGRFVVVEVLADSPAPFLDAAVARLAELDLLAVFAHPERCRALQRYTGELEDARAAGALVQVVAPSLLGRWGPSVQRTAWQLVRTGAADLVASDAHGPHRRGPHLGEAAAAIAREAGPAVAEELTSRAPSLVVRGSHPRA